MGEPSQPALCQPFILILLWREINHLGWFGCQGRGWDRTWLQTETPGKLPHCTQEGTCGLGLSRDIKMGSKKGSRGESPLWEIYVYQQIYVPCQHTFDHSHAVFVVSGEVGHYSSVRALLLYYTSASPTVTKTLKLVSQLSPWKPCLTQELSNTRTKKLL